jgi:hypothetical protein
MFLLTGTVTVGIVAYVDWHRSFPDGVKSVNKGHPMPSAVTIAGLAGALATRHERLYWRERRRVPIIH